ncbi:hypothetical protein K435DRAFT_880054, partial [Dendrothele bispora CBS 962.96]
MSAIVSLPSIHEMFPEHLMNLSPETRLTNSKSPSTKSFSMPKTPADDPASSFYVLRSDPRSTSLQHVASGSTLPSVSSLPPKSDSQSKSS